MQYYIQALKKYATFSGRATRSEYWYFILFNSFLIPIAIALLAWLIGSITETPSISAILFAIFWLTTFIPSLAVTVRRLHDINHSGWMMLITFIPIIGAIWFLVLLVLDSTPGTNNYGQNPKGIMNQDNNNVITGENNNQ